MYIVKRLTEFGEDNFIKLLDHLVISNNDKNKKWFPTLRADFKSKYLEWFFIVDDETNEFVAFSTIQKFYEGCFRVSTRCYIDAKHRRGYLPREDTLLTPASLMVIDQINYLGKFDTLFISLEGIKRQNTIKNMARKMEITTQLKWVASDRMMQTCPSIHTTTCWQNVCYTGELPKLASISKQEWMEINGNK